MKAPLPADLPPEPPAVPVSRARSMAAFFARKDQLVRWCLLTSFVSVLATSLSLLVALGAAQQPMRYVVITPDGDTGEGEGVSFADAKAMHIQQALLATTALLLRNPNDFDLPELLPVMFPGRMLSQAQTLRANEMAEFQLKQIHQQPSVARLEAVEIRPNAIRIQATGQLVRKGTFQGQGFVEPIPFTLDLVLKPNPDLLRHRRQRTVVTEFSLQYETAR